MVGTRTKMMLLCLQRRCNRRSRALPLPVSGVQTETELPIDLSLRHGTQQGLQTGEKIGVVERDNAEMIMGRLGASIDPAGKQGPRRLRTVTLCSSAVQGQGRGTPHCSHFV
jgi:hypothetical protein